MSQNPQVVIDDEDAPSIPMFILMAFIFIGCATAYFKGCEYGAVHGFTIDDSSIKFKQSGMGE